MEFSPRHGALVADGTIDRRWCAVEILQWVCGLVLRLLRLPGLNLLHRHLLLTSVIISLGMFHRGGHGLLLSHGLLRCHCWLLMLV